MRARLGLIVNPIAGIGGRLALKGSDSAELVAEVRRQGAEALAPERASLALEGMRPSREAIELFTAAGEMGEDEARRLGYDPVVLGSVARGETRAADTRAAAEAMVERAVDLLLFAGGDGTAVDILESSGPRVPVLGVPAGVKMHSAVFALNPRRAAELSLRFLQSESVEVKEAEVMDTDEDALRGSIVSPRFHGYLRVPAERFFVQSGKSRSVVADSVAQMAIAHHLVGRVLPGRPCLLGPGTTTRAVTDLLGLRKTLMGVDVVHEGSLVAADADERALLEIAAEGEVRIVVSPVGGQGFVFGRGNQQISARVLRQVGEENVVVVATESKLVALEGRPLLVDTGDDEVDAMLSGYTRVVTGHGREVVYRVGN